jgi:hypothetical protein
MPLDLVWLGGVLVALGGVAIFLVIRRRRSAEPQHFGKS